MGGSVSYYPPAEIDVASGAYAVIKNFNPRRESNRIGGHAFSITSMNRDFYFNNRIASRVSHLKIKLHGKDEIAKENDDACVVCFENKRIVVFGCGHLKYCIACTQKMMKTPCFSCPECRAPVKQALRVYA